MAKTCINTSTKEFIDTCHYYGVSPGALELALFTYVNDNNITELDYNDPFLINYIEDKFKIADSSFPSGEINNVEQYAVAIEYYKDKIIPKYSREILNSNGEEVGRTITVPYNKADKANAIINNLKDIFGEENVYNYKDNNGINIIKVFKPIFKEKSSTQELEESTSKNNIDPFKEAEELVNRIIEDSNNQIEFDEEKHQYIINGTPADTSVTQFLSKDIEIDPLWELPSSTLGTTVDTIVRDFFTDNFKKSYPNLNMNQLESLQSDLNKLRTSLDEKFGGRDNYKVVAKEFPISGIYSEVQQDGTSINKLMGGTMDIFIYDKDGNFYIYDIKTYRGNTNDSMNQGKIDKYTNQLTLYKYMLESKYPELKGKIKELNLIPFLLNYPSPILGSKFGEFYLKDIDNNLIYNEELLSEHKEYSSPILAPIINLTEGTPNVEFIQENSIISKDFEDRTLAGNIFNAGIVPDIEVKFLADNLMCNVSFIIGHLNTTPEASEYYFGDTFSKVDLTKMSREEVIKTVGIPRIINYLKETFFNTEKIERDIDFDISDKLDFIYDNWSEFITYGYSKLIALESATLINVKSLLESEDNKTKQEFETEILEEGVYENYQRNTRNMSFESRLSEDIKRLLGRIKNKDIYGNTIVDNFGYNLDTFIDPTIASNHILEWSNGTTTIEEFEESIKRMEESYSWVTEVLELIKEEPIRSKFFTNFNRDSMIFTNNVMKKDANGAMTFQTVELNVNSIETQLMNTLVTSFQEGMNPLFKDGKVDEELVNTIKSVVANLRRDLGDAFGKDKDVYKKLLEEASITVSKILSTISGSIIDPSLLRVAYSRDYNYGSFQYTSANSMLNHLYYIVNTLDKNKDTENYDPITQENDNIYNNFKGIFGLIALFTDKHIEASTYEDGKMYYSYDNPSYATKLINKIKNVSRDNSKFESFIEENFGQYKWFKDGDTWLTPWLETLIEVPSTREDIRISTQITSNKTPYKKLDPLSYSISIISNYSYDKSKKYAWYRMPIYSNKPVSEYIRFTRHFADYKEVITRGMENFFAQELMRIRAVLDRFKNEDSEYSPNYDIPNTPKYANIKSKLLKGENLTIEDLVVDGKFILEGTGASFYFINGFNEEILQGTPLGLDIINKINRLEVEDDIAFKDNLLQGITSFMDNNVKKEISYYEKLGLLDMGYNEKTKEYFYKYFPNFTRSYSSIKQSLNEYNSTLTEQELHELTLKEMREDYTGHLEEFIWNDYFAQANIIQLMSTDLAYYKGSDDFQKRAPQFHSPTIRPNVSAVDSKGVRYSADGKHRSISIADEIKVSEIIDNVKEIFNRELEKTPDSKKSDIKKMADYIVTRFKKVNVTDGQAYSSPTSYRKKLGMLGQWNSTLEEAYNRVKEGNFNVKDLGILMQPLKPFVFSNIKKNSYSKEMDYLRVPFQIKDSEYLLFLSDAIIKGGNKTSILTGIFNFMEDSAYDANGEYNGKGIDTVHFGSTVKVGLQSPISLNDAKTPREVQERLNKVYYTSSREELAENNMDRYDDRYVHTLPFEDYGIQQNVTEHYFDNTEQLQGSQARILSISDLADSDIFTSDGKNYTGKQLQQRYQDLVAKQIRESADKLAKELRLNGTRKEKNQAISKILLKTILSDSKYGIDLLNACSLDINGEFVIPLGESIQAVRVQELFNSIIKNNVNKQKTVGGSVVQVSSYGLSSDLNIIFNDKNGKNLLTRKEFENNTKIKEKYTRYEDYVKENQHSLAYIEVYIPIPSTDLEIALTKDDNSLMSVEEALGKGIISEDVLQLIAIRIPTEDKYSILPARIKGFMPKAAGSAIMFPEDITLITGSDFDIDKAYIQMKDLETKGTQWDDLIKDMITKSNLQGKELETYKNRLSSTVFSITQGDPITDKIAYKELMNFRKNNLGKYGTKFSVKRNANNEIFDLKWAVLTHPSTLSRMFNPGSFDSLEKMSSIVKNLENGSNESFNELFSKDKDILDESIETQKRNILFNSTQVYYHDQNMSASQMVGIFANNIVSHGFVEMQNISIKFDEPFTFNGITISGSTKLDPLTTFSGKFVSRTLAEFAAASLDAAKKPALNDLGINVFSSNIASLLARIGFDVEEISLFLSQPIIKEFNLEYRKRSNTGYITVNTVMQDFLNRFKTELNINPALIKKDLHNTAFTHEELADGIRNQQSNTEFQLRALLLFEPLYEKSKDLGVLTHLTKYNSVSNAAGPEISNTMELQREYDSFVQTILKGEGAFSIEAADVINNSPILKAFYETTVGENGLSNRIFNDYYEYYTDNFQGILRILDNNTKGTIKAATIKKLYNDYILFKLTMGDSPVLNFSNKSRNKFLREFPYKVSQFMQKIEGNALIDELEIRRKPKTPFPILALKSKAYSTEMVSKIKAGWADLLLNPSTKQLALDLFYYNVLRAGFSYSPNSFIHLASTKVKQMVPGYLEELRNPSNRETAIEPIVFIEQFLRNRSNDYKLVPTLKASKNINITKSISNNMNTINIQYSLDNINELDSIIINFSKITNKVTPALMIKYNNRLYKLIDSSTNNISYIETTPLGSLGYFMEYNAEEGANIKSILTETLYTSEEDSSEDSNEENDAIDDTGEDQKKITNSDEYIEREMDNITKFLVSNKMITNEDISSIKSPNQIDKREAMKALISDKLETVENLDAQNILNKALSIIEKLC